MILGLALVLVATGCKHKGVGVTELPDRKYTTMPMGKMGGNDRGGSISDSTPPSSTPSSISTDPNDPTAHPQPTGDWTNLPHDTAALAAQTIHFDLDSATIKSSEESKLQAVADYLKGNANKWLEVHGHCDERGTEGYNDSLGERRALAAREALIGLGIGGERIRTISHGEKVPADPGHDESAWRQNRRDEFVVVSPQ
jgi:peptidoglycan-associated lipoprotein